MFQYIGSQMDRFVEEVARQYNALTQFNQTLILAVLLIIAMWIVLWILRRARWALLGKPVEQPVAKAEVATPPTPIPAHRARAVFGVYRIRQQGGTIKHKVYSLAGDLSDLPADGSWIEFNVPYAKACARVLNEDKQGDGLCPPPPVDDLPSPDSLDYVYLVLLDGKYITIPADGNYTAGQKFAGAQILGGKMLPALAHQIRQAVSNS